MTEPIQETRKLVIYDAPGSKQEQVPEHTNHALPKHIPTGDTTTMARVLWYITGAIIALLAMRYGLSLLAANRANAFADLIYAVSYPFAAPFFGLFGYQVSYVISRFEIGIFVAMIAYVLIGYGLVNLVAINKRDREV